MEKKYCDCCNAEIHEGEEFAGIKGIYCSARCRAMREPDKVCDFCGRFNEHTTYNIELGDFICPNCHEEHVITCDYCGREVFLEYAYSGHSGRYCCRECMNDAERRDHNKSIVRNYGYKPIPKFYLSQDENQENLQIFPKEKIYYFGIENEMDAEEVGDEEKLERFQDKFYFKEDGSLREGGVEIISHPMSFKYHLTEANWEDLLDTASTFLEACDGCGMHVHVGVEEFNNRSETEANLVKFFNKFWDEMVDLSGRDYTSSLEEWASCPYLEYWENTDEEIVEECINMGRYQAVNLTNSNTVEIRIFQGVNDATQLYRNLALVYTIIEICDTMKWEDITMLNFEDDIYLPSLKLIKQTKCFKNIA